MLSITAVATLSAFLQPTPMLPSARTSSRGRRAVGAVAFVGDEEGIASAAISQDALLWTKTRGGLSYKDLEVGDGEAPEADQPCSIAFTATILGSGTFLEEVRRERPLTFVLDSAESPLFSEATAGMRVGGKRRINLPPSSTFSKIESETVQFELELVGVKSGLGAAAFKLGGGQGAPRVRGAIRLAFLASFVPDFVRLFGYLTGAAPDGAAAVAQVSDAAAAVAAHPATAAVVEASNRWAADGLANLF